MNDTPNPEPVVDPDLPDHVRTLLLRAHHTPPRRPLPVPRPLAEHPLAATLATVLVLLVGMRLLARVFVVVAALLLLAAAVVVLVNVAASGPDRAARRAWQRHRDRCITAEDLDPEAAALLLRAQKAAAAVDDAQVVRDDVLDTALNTAVLPRQLWETATALRRITQLRSRPAPDTAHDPEVAALLADRDRALRAAQRSVGARVAALEDYAARVAEADRAWQRAATLRRLLAEQEELRDLLAATAADEAAVRELADLTERAQAAEEHLRTAADRAAQAASRLPGADT